MVLIGLISDVHASPAPVAEAIRLFNNAGVSQIFCAGDIAGYGQQLQATIILLKDSGCQSITGNHDLQYIDLHKDETDNPSVIFLKQLPKSIETSFAGIKLAIVHAQPPEQCHGGIKLLNKNGLIVPAQLDEWKEKLKNYNYDVLVVGHTHQVFVEKIGGTLVINPGSSVFNNSCALLCLPDMRVEIIPLSGKEIEKTWNWSEHVIYAGIKKAR